MQKMIENLEFVQIVNFEFIDSLKNNCTKYLLISDNSCEDICTSKAFVGIDTAGRHGGLSTTFIRHNLFNRSEPGRDVELQNTHLVLFKFPRDVMQLSTLSAQLRLGSELVDWYGDATSVLYGHFLIDLSPPTDERLCYCTNTGSLPSKFHIPDRVNRSKVLDDEHKISFLSKCSNFFPTKAKVFYYSVSQKSLSVFVANAY